MLSNESTGASQATATRAAVALVAAAAAAPPTTSPRSGPAMTRMPEVSLCTVPPSRAAVLAPAATTAPTPRVSTGSFLRLSPSALLKATHMPPPPPRQVAASTPAAAAAAAAQVATRTTPPPRSGGARNPHRCRRPQWRLTTMMTCRWCGSLRGTPRSQRNSSGSGRANYRGQKDQDGGERRPQRQAARGIYIGEAAEAVRCEEAVHVRQ